MASLVKRFAVYTVGFCSSLFKMQPLWLVEPEPLTVGNGVTSVRAAPRELDVIGLIQIILDKCSCRHQKFFLDRSWGSTYGFPDLHGSYCNFYLSIHIWINGGSYYNIIEEENYWVGSQMGQPNMCVQVLQLQSVVVLKGSRDPLLGKTERSATSSINTDK